LSDGKVGQMVYKGLLPNYDVFDEYRYFEPATTFHTVSLKGRIIAVTICEDLWNMDNRPLYTSRPMDSLKMQHPEVIINIAASPFAWNHGVSRMNTLTANALRYQLPLLYVNQVGGQTDLLFDGGSSVIGPDGRLLSQLPFFKEGLKVVDLDALPVALPGQPSGEGAKNLKYSLIHDALVMGIRDYFRRMGLKKAIVGASGGIDSAVTIVLAARALGPENVWAVLLPGPFSSSHSVEDAIALAQNLGMEYDTLSINEVVQSLEKTLHPHFKGSTPGTAEENLQARARSILLMGLSNKHGHVLLNTSNKSEAAVGYGTLYGDMCGGLSVLGDLYKTEVYQLAHYINKEKELIPEHSIKKPPSAELKPDQKDSDSLPEYEVLDKILFQYIEEEKSPAAIIAGGYEAELVKRVTLLVNNSEHKRRQSPPVLRVSEKAFGSGRKMPVAATYPS
jgi:NAD+ synthase (glutamine-hydrolysing)